MFGMLAVLEAALPTRSEMDELERVRQRALQFDSPSDRLREYDRLCVDLRLTQVGREVFFAGPEPTTYLGAADGWYVFAVTISDDCPVWLHPIFALDAAAECVPAENESVYVFVLQETASESNARLGVWRGSSADWDIKVNWPLSDHELMRLLELADLAD